MFLTGQQNQEVTRFDGPQQSVRPENLGPTQAVEAFNCEYTPQGVRSRRGWNSQVAIVGPISDMVAWAAADFSRLVLLINGTTLTARSMDSLASVNTLATLSSSVGFSAAQYGSSLFVAGYNKPFPNPGKIPAGTTSKVVGQDPFTPTTVIADDLWPGAPSVGNFNLDSTTDFGSGGVTAGQHFLALVITTRTGQVCPPLRLGWNFTSAANRLITVQFDVSAATPDQYYKLQFAMTAANDSQQGRYYIIPQTDNAFAIPAGGLTNAVLAINTPDSVLISEGQPLTDLDANFFQGQVINGVSTTLAPYIVKTHEQRMSYVVRIPSTTIPGVNMTESAILFSDPGLPQSVGLARSIVQLPGARPITAVASQRGAYYVFGPTYTYVLYSTPDQPVTWATAQLINDQIGASGLNSVCESAGGAYIIVAAPTGLWILSGGAYSAKPLSWYCEDWARITWAEYLNIGIRVVDLVEEQKILVIAPLDTNLEPTHILCFDYANGLSAETVRYSLWQTEGEGQGDWKAYATAMDFSTGKTCLWRAGLARAVGVPAQNQIQVRYPYDQPLSVLYPNASTDGNVGAVTVPLKSRYIHAPLPTEGDEPLKLNGLELRARTKNGVITPSVESKDGSRTTGDLLVISDGADSPEAVKTRYFNLRSEGGRFRIDAVGGWLLDKLRMFWAPFTSHR